MISLRRSAICLGVLLIGRGATAASVIYVDADATGANDGSSWADAYIFLQDGLISADSGDQVWVASGIYRPDQGGVQSPGDRTASFAMRPGVAIYGGFAGGETDLEQRDWVLNEVVLSGDLLDNDGPDFQNIDENSYNVVVGSNVPNTSILDGVTVRSGFANGEGSQAKGAGIRSGSGSASYRNCRIMFNRATDVGGAVNISSGSPQFIGTTISYNVSDNDGGGFAIVGGNPALIDCIIEYNVAEELDDNNGRGGGIYSVGQTTLSLINCTLRGNWSQGRGGGLENLAGSKAIIRSCLFVQNGTSDGNGGGGIDNFYDCNLDVANSLFIGNWCEGVSGAGILNWDTATLTNCVFYSNVSESSGAGCSSSLGDELVVTNCIFWNNISDGSISENAQLSSGNSTALTISNSCIQNWSGKLGGAGNTGSYPLFINARGDDGVAGTEDDDLHIGIGSPCIDAGNSEGVPEPDFDGAERFVDDPTMPDTGSGFPTVDMGAYEFQADCNGNGVLDSVDIANGLGNDCNSNGKLDVCDLEDGTLSDSDGNGVPDQCRPVVYVKWDATGENDGTSWANAYGSLQDALELARGSSGGVKELWVAAGTYLPDQGGGQTRGDRTASFSLVDSVGVYGGFDGTETELDQRDPATNLTRLSGDLLRNDGADFTNNEENSYHVVVANQVDTGAILDGFIILSGNANGVSPDDVGAGLAFSRASPKISACLITRNTSTTGGGGLYSPPSNATFSNCSFVDNRSQGIGGAVYTVESEIAFSNVDWIRNISSGWGGAVGLVSSDDTFNECTFHGNSAEVRGGAILMRDFGDPVFTACSFIQNGTGGAGGAVYEKVSDPKYIDCSFSGNSALNGGAIYTELSVTEWRTCVFERNSAVQDGGAIYSQGGNLQESRTYSIVDSLLIGNEAGSAGGGIYNHHYSDSTLVNTRFLGNFAKKGAGFNNDFHSTPLLVNCLFSGNTASDHGAGIFNQGNAYPHLVQATFSENTALGGFGGGIYSEYEFDLSNSVLWGNVDSGSSPEQAQIFFPDAIPIVNYCCIEGLTGDLGGVGNLGSDPHFVDPDGDDDVPGTMDDLLQLSAGSPCIDAASNALLPPDEGDMDEDENTAELTPLDLGGGVRRYDDPLTPDTGSGKAPIVDMGAYEFGSAAD